VRELLRGIADLAPASRPQPADPRPISPEEPDVAGFVFKVQANIDPQHRNRIAFVRIASGRFQRGMKLKNIRTGRVMSVQAPVFSLARERNLAEEAWPGDIIGIPNHGSLRIGDILRTRNLPWGRPLCCKQSRQKKGDFTRLANERSDGLGDALSSDG
jgi:peptide chain release factor 3